MSETSNTKLITKIVVVDKGEAYETKGVSLGESEVLTTLTSLVQEYQNTYDELNQKVTALETKYNQGRVKIVDSMMELKNNPEENMLYINDEVKAIVDDGSGIIPKAYISDGSEITLKEIERKEEDPDDGNEYIGYVHKLEYLLLNITIAESSAILNSPGSDTTAYGASKYASDPEGNAVVTFPTSFGGITGLGAQYVSWLIDSTNPSNSQELVLSKDLFNGSGINVTRLDTNLTVYGAKTVSNLVYDLNTGVDSSLFTLEDVGKTIQIKIEVA